MAKNVFVNICKIILITALIVSLFFTINTAIQSFRASEVSISDYVGHYFVTYGQNIMYVGNEYLLIDKIKYDIISNQGDTFIISHEDQEYALKFVDKNKLYSELGRRYYYYAK